MARKKLPSAVGEAAATSSALTFLMWAANLLPQWMAVVPIALGMVFIVDWMFGGISDKGICKWCFE